MKFIKHVIIHFMKHFINEIEEHYYSPYLYSTILSGLKAMNVDIYNVQRSHIAGVDEFHVRGAEVSKELAKIVNLHDATVLDIGCGIGGSCRMLADEFNCQVTGIDLNVEFINTATKLSQLVGLTDKTEFIWGNAIKLPLINTSFEIVWTQHVQMNIMDKRKFYSEIHRVLSPEGTFIYYDIFKTGSKEVVYPMPWANTATISFLFPISEMKKILNSLGFKKEQTTDQTIQGILFFEQFLKKIEISEPSKLGLNVLMGSTTKIKIINLLSALKEGTLMLGSGVYKKSN